MDCLFVLIAYNESVIMSTKIMKKVNKSDKKRRKLKRNAQWQAGAFVKPAKILIKRV